jgi:hypothetical protein
MEPELLKVARREGKLSCTPPRNRYSSYMEIVIFFKPIEGKTVEVRYRMDLDHFKRLSADFQSYIKTGQPKEGIYTVQTVKGDPGLNTPKKVRLRFDEISAIG